jgi:Ca2+-binding EF-hand superfamily protein
VKPGSALAAYDANGDGLLDPDEVRKAIARVKAQWKQARISRFDTDGDGTLNQEERQAMGQSYRQDASGMQDWALRRFDLDGDGQLNQDEKAVMKEMRQSFQATMKRLADRVMDANGDGEITKLEKASVAMAWSQEGSLLILKAQDWIDADSDAEVTWEEQRDFRRSGMRALRKWFDKFSAPYDQDGDGTFSRGEVRELMQGVDQELDRRLKLADADEDGRLTAREAVSALEDLGREMGVIPSQTPASRPASRSR